MLDDLSPQKRMFIAVCLSILFFAGYWYVFPPKQPITQEINSTNTTLSQEKQAPTTQKNTPDSKTKQEVEILTTINGKYFEAKIDALGRISKFYLNEEKFIAEDGNKMELVKKEPYPLEVRFSDASLNELAFKNYYSANKNHIDIKDSEESVTLTQDLGSVTLNKTITFNPNGSYKVSINLSTPVDYFITPGFRPDVAVDSYTVHGLMIKQNEGSLFDIQDGDAKGDETFKNAFIAAASDRYYTTLFYDLQKGLNVAVTSDTSNDGTIFVSANGDTSFNGFIGPKAHDLLKNIDKELLDVIEYGWFTFLAKPLFSFLNLLHGFLGNWGWAIVAMTLVIRIILFPLTFKGMVSMNKLKDIAPKIKEIQNKYKGDPQKMQAHMMELYRKSGANPMGGCLPILLQIPIFFAIYRVLLNAIELKGAEWILWINDLAIKDPYFILPILMGATMFLQQHLTPTNFTDPMQEKIMKFLPLIFTFFFITFPAGLTLYWFVNNVCSIIQQLIVNAIFNKNKQKEIAEAKHEKI